MRKNITIETTEFSGYYYECFTISVAEHQFEKAVDLINESRYENEEITLDDIEDLLNENAIDFYWVEPEIVIRL